MLEQLQDRYVAAHEELQAHSRVAPDRLAAREAAEALERKRREDDEVQRMLELTEAREATAKVAAELQVYKDAEAAAFHKTTEHYKAWADFKAANMETVGASQTVVKGTGAFPF